MTDSKSIKGRGNQSLATGLVLCLVGINVFWLFGGSPRNSPHTEAATRARLQQEEQKTWSTQPSDSLASLSLDELSIGECERYNPVPDGCAQRSVDELTASQRDDLAAAVVGLCAAYREDSAVALVSYMQSRGEELDAESVSMFQQILTNELGFSQQELDVLPAAKTLALFWTEAGIRSHWSEAVPGSSCLTIWSTSLSHEQLRDTLGAFDSQLWQRKGWYRHNFRGPRTVDELRDTTGEVVYADLRLIVRHDAELYQATHPYHVRFFYDSVDERWRPLRMHKVAATRDTPRKMLF